MADVILNYVRCPHCGGNAGVPEHDCPESRESAERQAAEVLAREKPNIRSASYLSPHQMRRLDLACAPVRKAFPNYGPYLVGSVLERADFRDVDVRVILKDQRFDRMFPKATVHADAGAHDDVTWSFLCSTISHWLTDVSGLPVDFQIQRMTEANAFERYQGKFRNPLGVRSWVA